MKKPLSIALIFVAASAAALWVVTQHAHRTDRASAPAGRLTLGPICVAQYVSHPLLDAAYAGFRAELDKEKYPSSQIQFENANADATASALVADKVCRQNCAVILALGTPMAQSVKASCPRTQAILFGAITDPKSAGLVGGMEAPGGNVTGTSDQWPYDLQMRLIAQFWGPDATVGVPFNPAEANTQYAMQQIRTSARRLGLKLHEVPINSVTEASQAVDALANSATVVYVPADNTAVAAAPGIVAAANRFHLPVVAGDPGTFKAGAVLGIGVDYFNLGVINAQQALSILKGSSPATMPVRVSSHPELFISEERAVRFHIDPAAVRAWYDRALTQGQ